MSAYEDQLNMDMNKVPTKALERAYWRRRLPAAFRFYLEMVSRELMLSQPNNIHAHAAGFFEELLLQRDTELSLLPYEPYFDKLAGRRAKQSVSTASGKADIQIEKPIYPIHASTTTEPCVKCARCGRKLKPGQPADGGAGGAVRAGPTAPDTLQGDGKYRHVEGDGMCTVMALTPKRDAYGRLLMRKGSKMEQQLLNELCMLVDY